MVRRRPAPPGGDGGLGVFKRARDQRRADAALAERRFDRERPQQQRRRLADADRRQPHRADQRGPTRAVNERASVGTASRTEGAARVAAGTEGALVQPLAAGASSGVSGRMVSESSLMASRSAPGWIASITRGVFVVTAYMCAGKRR